MENNMVERYPDDFLLVNVPFEDLAVRIRNVARVEGWETVAAVRYVDDVELLHSGYLGRKALNEIRRLIPREAKGLVHAGDRSLEDRVAVLERKFHEIGLLLRSVDV